MRKVLSGCEVGARVNLPFLRSLKTYSGLTRSDLAVVPIYGKDEGEPLSPNVLDLEAIVSDTHLTRKLKVSDYRILPQQIDPSTGLARFARDEGCTIFSSPKVRLKVVPTSNFGLPKTLMTTGALTLPNYRDNRIGMIGRRDHRYGAVVVDSDDNSSKFHARYITSLANGKFFDLNRRYTPEGSELSRPEALVLGDWHTGKTCPDVREATKNLVSFLNPKRVFIHDFFDAYSISHHNLGRSITSAKVYEALGNNLELELTRLAREAHWFDTITPDDCEVVVVKGNHDEHLDRYLEEARYVNEPQNLRMASLLVPPMIDGYDPLVKGLELCGGIPGSFRFLSRDEDYKVRGWQLGNHGDLGANGGRGSNRSIEYAHSKSIVGHRHSPEIFRGLWVVGTSTPTKLDYTKGFSSWMNSHIILHEDGNAQMLNYINGSFGERTGGED